jgi:tRNA 5-methylaminomethyl-2-thiouridine biosynthesis bifunctional protein
VGKIRCPKKSTSKQGFFRTAKHYVTAPPIIKKVKNGVHDKRSCARGLPVGIENPEIDWRNNAPYSLRFNDIYYSTENGLAETRHVFIDGNDLTVRFKELSENKIKSGFTIFETGFGSGLNFCVAAKVFLETIKETAQDKYLNYISVEKYPLAQKDIQKTLGMFPELHDVAQALIDNYPARTAGVHRVFLHRNIILTLIFEDRLYALNQLRLAASLDAWFLDGFSPAQNGDMWSDDLFLRIAEVSGVGTTLSTFTCAGHVRRKLIACGFDAVKIKGFGGKREIITATMGERSAAKRSTSTKPWYYLQSKKPESKKVAVIGAGLSGCALADAFAKRNWRVDLIDQNHEICSGASGNPLGIFFPVIHRKPTFTSRFSTASYLYLLRHLKNLVDEGCRDLPALEQKGLLQVIENARENDRFTNFDLSRTGDQAGLDRFYEFLDRDIVKNRFGINSQGGVFFADAGFVSPKGLCQANLTRHEKINPVNLLLSNRVEQYHFENGLWNVYDSHNRLISRADVLVLANSWAMNDFADTRWLQLQKIRGQLVIPEIQIPGFEIPVSAQTYMIPAGRGVIIGATHDRFDDVDVRFEQNLELIQNSFSFFPALEKPVGDLFLKEGAIDSVKKMTSRVSFRSAADDHFPVIGRLPNTETYNEIFRNLSDGETNFYYKNGYGEQPQAWHENLYCLTGCGSRGIIYSQLGAELIASMANSFMGEPLPIEKDLFEALSPARFLVRALKRGFNEV